jgi:hypothetical protein
MNNMSAVIKRKLTNLIKRRDIINKAIKNAEKKILNAGANYTTVKTASKIHHTVADDKQYIIKKYEILLALKM